MDHKKRTTVEQVLQDKTEKLIAIGAAAAANCIPCFEHLYENAINAGITVAEIKRASEIAGQVKTGASIALSNSVNELLGTQCACDSGFDAAGPQTCSC